MTAPRRDCGHIEVTRRALALLADPGRLRRLRVTYRADPVYDELLAVSVAVLGASERTGMAIAIAPGDAGLMTSDEFAAAAGISRRAVQRACAEGRIRASKGSGVWLIPVAELAARRVA